MGQTNTGYSARYLFTCRHCPCARELKKKKKKTYIRCAGTAAVPGEDEITVDVTRCYETRKRGNEQIRVCSVIVRVRKGEKGDTRARKPKYELGRPYGHPS